MAVEEDKTYPVLHYIDFFKKYGLTKDTSRFIGRSYSQSSNAVSVYESELDKDCYFQCPDYGETVVPEKRRYIYVLKANTYKDIPYTINTAPGGNTRYSINIQHLKLFSDPYNEGVENVIEEKLTPEEELISKIQTLIKEYEQERSKS